MSSGAREPATPVWLVVLGNDRDDDVAQLCAALRERGWSVDSSRGAEQSILAVEGPHDPAELEAVIAARCEADVIPLLSRARYQALRARRRFQSALVAGLALLIAVGMVVPLVGFLQPPPGTISDPQLLRAAPAERLEVGEAVLVRLPEPVLVVRVAAERWQAVKAGCTFMDDCVLEWNAERRQIECPCHGCVFDVHGNVVRPPAALPLVRLTVVRAGDELFVRRTL